MSKFLTPKLENNYNYFLRVLAFLAEQKIATANQIEKYCFVDASNGYMWKLLNNLRKAKLIEAKELRFPGKRKTSGFYLSKLGLRELKEQSQMENEDFQIASNSPYHDVILGDLRIVFSQIQECRYFLTENLIRSKVIENDLPEMSVFRSYRCDSAVLMKVNNQNLWLSLEYERSQKSYSRYVQRIKNWYLAENLTGILLVAENDSLIQMMNKIDLATLPNLQRKILYISKDQILSANKKVQFFNCQKHPLTFNIGESLNIQYPILNQTLAKL